MLIYISGSIAYDRIMDFPDRFKNHILPNKIHILNVSFTIGSIQESFGGTAGNIAYNLKLLGMNPNLLGVVGKDFGPYGQWLLKNKISIDNLKIMENELTTSAYVMTDLDDNQITAFHFGALKINYPKTLYPKETKNSLAIISPGNKHDMLEFIKYYKQQKIPYIFDPGQAIPIFTKQELLAGISESKVSIVNDYELELVLAKTKFTKNSLIQKPEILITTLGENGSRIETKNEAINIPAVKLKRVIDPTGAGDAYRAGLIKGLSENKSLLECGKLGSCAASYAVEHTGTQNHSYTINQFNKRLKTLK